ncbi:MAG: ribbon-helix-helix protein, CopG family [Candidatus Bathyarchaeia archaeon]
MPRKCIVKVILSKEQKEMLEELARRLGTSESETMRMALMDYAKSLSLVEERVRRHSASASSFDSKSSKPTT